MLRKLPKIALGASILLSAALISCNSDRAEVPSSPDAAAANSAPAAAELKQVAITSETPVEVSWRYCDTALFPTPPPEMPQYLADADGCRIGSRQIRTWPLEDGMVEIYFVRDRSSPGTMTLGEAENYAVAMKSRGCDPDGPGEEGYYRAGELVTVWRDVANDEKLIQVPPGDVVLSAIEPPDDDSDSAAVSEGFLYFGTSRCRQIDPDRVF